MYENKSPAEAHDLVEQGWVYLDVRTPGEFSGGHPTGSKNVPVATPGPGGMMLNPQFIQVVSRLVPKDTKLVVGCASGGRSARACQMLAQMGYQDLVNVDGGFSGRHNAFGQVEVQGWEGSGLPTSRGDDEGSYAAVLEKIRADQG